MVDYMKIIDLPFDIINIIIDMLPVRDKIYFMATNIYFSKNVCIFSMFCNIKISPSVIKQKKFRNLQMLTLYNNINFNVSNLTKLTYLKVGDYPIEGVSYLTNLRELCVNSCTNNIITQNDIMNLSLLTSLHISFNKKISNINHLSNLLSLEISGRFTEFYQSSISNLTNITYLNIETNTHITNLSHMPNLLYLRCYGTNIDISKLYKLRTLNLFDRFANIDISHLTNLTELEASKEYICNNKITINNLSKLIYVSSINNLYTI